MLQCGRSGGGEAPLSEDPGFTCSPRGPLGLGDHLIPLETAAGRKVGARISGLSDSVSNPGHGESRLGQGSLWRAMSLTPEVTVPRRWALS